MFDVFPPSSRTLPRPSWQWPCPTWTRPSWWSCASVWWPRASSRRSTCSRAVRHFSAISSSPVRPIKYSSSSWRPRWSTNWSAWTTPRTRSWTCPARAAASTKANTWWVQVTFDSRWRVDLLQMGKSALESLFDPFACVARFWTDSCCRVGFQLFANILRWYGTFHPTCEICNQFANPYIKKVVIFEWLTIIAAFGKIPELW